MTHCNKKFSLMQCYFGRQQFRQYLRQIIDATFARLVV